jgi:hypothetical protein
MSFRACEESLTSFGNGGATVPVASVSTLHPSDLPRPRPGRTEIFAFLFDPPIQTLDKHQPTLRWIHRRIHLLKCRKIRCDLNASNVADALVADTVRLDTNVGRRRRADN